MAVSIPGFANVIECQTAKRSSKKSNVYALQIHSLYVDSNATSSAIQKECAATHIYEALGFMHFVDIQFV